MELNFNRNNSYANYVTNDYVYVNELCMFLFFFFIRSLFLLYLIATVIETILHRCRYSYVNKINATTDLV